MSSRLTTRERWLLVILLLLFGGSVLWVLAQTAPPMAKSVTAMPGSGPGGPDGERASRPAELPPLPPLPAPRLRVLLVPATGAATADLVLSSDGSWRVTASAGSRPAGTTTAPASRPEPALVGPLVVALPAPLAELDARARGSLARCLEAARRVVMEGDRVMLPADAAANEREELERLRRWLR